MNIPFSKEQFIDVIVQYNNFIWPFQIILVLLAFCVIYSLFKNGNRSNQFISLIVSFFWIWIGIVYHLLHFTSINPAAYAFGTFNILEGILFFYYGFVKSSLSFKLDLNVYGYTGAILIVYGLIIYPILGFYLGHVYPESPTFGLPCPTTIFTFGIILFTNKHIPVPLLIIPFVWSIIGFFAALNFGITEDIGLLVAGLFGTVLLVIRNRSIKQE